MKLNSEKQYTIRFKASDLKNILRCVYVGGINREGCGPVYI